MNKESDSIFFILLILMACGIVPISPWIIGAFGIFGIIFIITLAGAGLFIGFGYSLRWLDNRYHLIDRMEESNKKKTHL